MAGDADTTEEDGLTRAFYELGFHLAFVTKTGDDFQAFFSSVMEKRYPADFIRVRPWGNVGDQKNDGYLRSRRTLFQVYAPDELAAAPCLAKIDEDFAGALPHWKAHFGTWIFVHNAKRGLGPQVTKRLLELDAQHRPLVVTSWGFEELRQEAMSLTSAGLASLLGPAPTRQRMAALGLHDLAPVLDHIARLPQVGEPDLRPVPADKLEANLLSGAVRSLLRAGMSRADVVGKYFRLRPPLQDDIAASFRREYQRLRDGQAAPDEIFAGLQRFAGGDLVSAPGHQEAVLAVLAFFFEECDIFERPIESDA